MSGWNKDDDNNNNTNNRSLSRINEFAIWNEGIQ